MKKFFYGKKWFFENIIEGELVDIIWGFTIDRKIYTGKSKFQKIEVYENVSLGKILLLDGYVELTTGGEFVYHELLVHPAFCYFKGVPKKVLILGGGDGGALREVLKWPVDNVKLIEIDEKVIEVSRKYLPEVSQGAFDDPRVEIIIGDVWVELPKLKEKFDIIIFDLSDSKGPAKKIYSFEFFKKLKLKLSYKGILAAQTAFLREKYAVHLRVILRDVFANFILHKAFIESYPLDEHTFSFVSDSVFFEKIDGKIVDQKLNRYNIKTYYYSGDIHTSSRQIPKFFQQFIFDYKEGVVLPK